MTEREQPSARQKELFQLRRELRGYRMEYWIHRGRVVIEGISQESRSHPVKMREHGLRTRAIRRVCGLSLREVADGIEENPVKLLAFESGWIPPEQLEKGFEQKLEMFLKGAVTVRRKVEGQSGNSQG